MSIRLASVSSSILFTILIDALIVSGSICIVVGVWVIGHSFSGNLRKSGPVCHYYWYQCRLVFYHVLTNQQCYFYFQSNTSHSFRYLLESLRRVLRRMCWIHMFLYVSWHVLSGNRQCGNIFEIYICTNVVKLSMMADFKNHLISRVFGVFSSSLLYRTTVNHL